MLPESCQLLRSLGSLMSEWQGPRGRLLKVSPLRTGFWSSISWLVNLRGGGGEEEERLEHMDADFTWIFGKDSANDLNRSFFFSCT